MNEPTTWHPSHWHLTESFAAKLAAELGLKTFAELHTWSVDNREEFWKRAATDLQIVFDKQPDRYLEWNPSTCEARYLVGAQLNIAKSCLVGSGTALVEQNEAGEVRSLTFAELKQRMLVVAGALVAQNISVGDAVAVDMPMTTEAVTAYLAIVWIGAVVVSIADSFAPDEIATRLRLGNAKLIITQDVVLRGGKQLPMMQKVAAATSLPMVVVATDNSGAYPLRAQDISWTDFLARAQSIAPPAALSDGMHAINILFSSGTTGDPKAILWNQSTPLKCAADARYHHNVAAGDLLCWPTNLGWMMGPWLLFAAWLNRAGVALYSGSPLDQGFADFVERQRVTLLGVVPSLVKTWRQKRLFENKDLSALKVFSSTGECSNADDMRYLMSLARYKSPVIEYCGGTEIGGAYLSASVMQPNRPAEFSTPTLGIDVAILDSNFQNAPTGEVFLIGPSIGLSTTLLNRDHYQNYFADSPVVNGKRLRKHGDEIMRLPDGGYQALGRSDDTMNLGGIKVSSAEIERALNESGLVSDCAAIAVPPAGGGPSLLVIYIVVRSAPESAIDVRLSTELQKVIRDKLNPLFKISDVVAIDVLPRTASNKVMRRVLRDDYRNRPTQTMSGDKS